MSDSSDQESQAFGEGPSPKRRRGSSTVTTEDSPICIVHRAGLKPEKYGPIKLLSPQGNGKAVLSKLQVIKFRRLAEPPSSSYRMTDVCNKIPDSLAPNHGYHRECYKRFTMNLSRLSTKSEDAQDAPSASVSEDAPSTSKSDNAPTTSRPTGESDDNVIFTPDCIFCNSTGQKKKKVKRCWTSEGLSVFKLGGWRKVEEIAEQKGDEKLLRRIKGYDLFACKAKYHPSCRIRYYIPDPSKWRSKNPETRDRQKSLEEVHAVAFQKVCEVIDKEILEQKRMKKFSELRNLYISYLEDTEFSNPEYRGDKIKQKLLKHPKYSKCLSFNQGHVVYNSTYEAIKNAYREGSSDITQDCGNHVDSVR